MMMLRQSLIVGLSLFLGVDLVFAQNMQVIGGNSMAKECYRASTSAALSGTAGAKDLQSCNRALENGNLRKRDVIATYVNRGVVNTTLKNFNAAAKDYNRAIKMNPGLAEAYVNRGNLWFIASRFTDAITDYDKAMNLGFSQPHLALLNRGMVKEAIGQLDSAKDDYLAALDDREEWDVAKQKLERVNIKINQRRLQNQKEQQQEKLEQEDESKE